MADSRIVRIVLQAVDQASAVVGKVGQEISKTATGIGGTFKRLGNEAADFLSNKFVQVFGVAGILGAVRKAWQEVDTFDASVRKLEGTAKVTGVPLATLQEIASKAKDQFKLSAVQANDFAVEMAKLAEKAGDVGKASPALAAFLEIGAAKGLSAQATLKAVQQAILGIDEGTDKLFNKNPSVIYAEFADRIGTTVGKLSDQQKAQALLNAALEDGLKVGGAYAAYLESAAGKQEQLTIRVQEAAVEFGKSTTEARLWLIETGAAIVEGFNAFVGGIKAYAIDAALLFQTLSYKFRNTAGEILITFSSLIGESRVVLTIFGDAATEIADRLGDAGVKMVRESAKQARLVEGVRIEMYQELAGITIGGEKKVTDATGAGHKRRRTLTQEEKDAAEKLAKERAKELERINEELAVKTLMIEEGLTESQAKEFVRRRGILTGHQDRTVNSLEDGYDRLDDLNLLLAAGFDKDVRPAVKRTETQVVDFADAIKTEFPPAKEHVQGVGDEAKGLDGKFGDAASAVESFGRKIGEMDEVAGQALTSVGELAGSILRATGGDPTALVGAIGNFAGLLGSVFGGGQSAAAKEALRKHQQSIEENTRQIGDLMDFQSTGRVVSGASKTLGDILGGTTSRPRGGASISVNALNDVLAQNGLTIPDLVRLANDFGISDLIVNGQVDAGKLFDLFQLLPTKEPGLIGQDFGSQLSFLDRSLGLGALSPAGEFGGLAGLASRFGATGLTDILSQFDVTTPEGRAAALDAFRNLFLDFNRGGGVDEAIFGNLNGAQFSELIGRFIDILADPEKVIGGFTLGGIDPPDIAFSLDSGFENVAETFRDGVDTSNTLLSSIDRKLGILVDAGGGSLGGVGSLATVDGALADLFQVSRDNLGLADRD